MKDERLKKNNQEERGSKRKNKKERRFRKSNSIRANSRPGSLAASHTWRGNTRVAGNWEIRDIRDIRETSNFRETPKIRNIPSIWEKRENREIHKIRKFENSWLWGKHKRGKMQDERGKTIDKRRKMKKE